MSQSLCDLDLRKHSAHFEKPNLKVESKLGDPKLGGVSDWNPNTHPHVIGIPHSFLTRQVGLQHTFVLTAPTYHRIIKSDTNMKPLAILNPRFSYSSHDFSELV